MAETTQKTQRSLLSSSLSVDKIQRSVTSFSKSLNNTQKTTLKLNTTLISASRFKRESLANDRNTFQKRREASRRREQEDIVEASTVGGAIRRQGKAVASSTKGFLGRILDFIGTLMVGWLLQNLPIIVNLAQQLIGRIQKLVGILGGFIKSTTEVLSGFGSLLTGIFSNLVSFDFTDQSGQINRALTQMESGFMGIERDFTQAYNLLTEPLDLGFDELKFPGDLQQEGGEGEPGAPSSTYEGPGGPETTGGGKILSPQAGYSYLRQLGVSNTHALGILANIKGESGFRIDSKQPDGPGIGLFQYSSAGRKQAFLQNVPDWKTNWKGQIKYAIGEGVGPTYLKTQFSSPEEAAEWWMNEWERPDPSVKSGRRKKHNDFIKSFKPGGTEKPTTATPSAPIPPAAVNPQKRYSKGQSIQGVGQITSLRGQRTDPVTGKSGAWHGGVDIGMDIGIYISCKYPASVAYAGSQGGYGNFIDIRIPALGIMLRFAHLSRILIRSGNIPAGKPFALSGNSGTRTTGPHVHLEAHGFNETPQQLAYGGDRDPSPYIEFIMFTRSAPKGFVAPPAPSGTKNLAQISVPASSQEVSAQLTTERAGQLVFMPLPESEVAPSYPESGPSSGGKTSSTPMFDETALNRMVAQKLLLDLAYT